MHAGKRTGIYYIDSTCLPVCHLKRSKRHKTFEEIAQYGRTSVGWFFGLKLHIVINNRGELMAGIAAYVIEPLKISAIKLLASNNYLAETPKISIIVQSNLNWVNNWEEKPT